MKIFNKKPVWEIENEYKAIEATKNIEDAEVLKNIALKSKIVRAREIAVTKLNGGRRVIDGSMCPICQKSEAVESKTWEEERERLILSNNIGNDYYVTETVKNYIQVCKYCGYVFKEKSEAEIDDTNFREAHRW